jgi:hypothetical protein
MEKNFPDGFYVGDLVNGKRDGQGKMSYAHGNIYEGNWENGRKNGFGKMIYTSGNVYEGNWEKGNRNGFGKMNYANGEIYEGEWFNNKKNGSGTMTDQDGNVLEGTWISDVFTPSKPYNEDVNLDSKEINEGKTSESIETEIKIPKNNNSTLPGEIKTPNTPNPSKKKSHKLLYTFLSIITLFIVSCVVLAQYGNSQSGDSKNTTLPVSTSTTSSPSATKITPSPTETHTPKTVVTIDKTKIQSIIASDTDRNYSVYIKNLNTGEEFKTSDADSEYPALGEAFIPISLASDYYLSSDSSVNFYESDIPAEESAYKNDYLNNSFTVSSLISKMMSTSSGTAANKLIQLISAQNSDSSDEFNLINSYLSKHDYSNTHIGRIIYDKTSTDDNEISAADLASMLTTIESDENSNIYSCLFETRTGNEKNADAIQKTFSDNSSVIVGSKFGIADKPYRGYESNFYNDAAIIKSDDGKIKFVIAVLSKGSNANKDAETVISNIASTVYDDIKSN